MDEVFVISRIIKASVISQAIANQRKPKSVYGQAKGSFDNTDRNLNSLGYHKNQILLYMYINQVQLFLTNKDLSHKTMFGSQKSSENNLE